MDGFNLEDTYWDRIKGFVTELRVDARWILRNSADDKPYGSLRIVSHPDLKLGHLRAIFTYVTSIKNKNKSEILKTINDYCIESNELEVYSIDRDVNTETRIIEAPLKELQNLFNVKIFE